MTSAPIAIGDHWISAQDCHCRVVSRLPRDWCSWCVAEERAFRSVEAMRARERRRNMVALPDSLLEAISAEDA